MSFSLKLYDTDRPGRPIDLGQVTLRANDLGESDVKTIVAENDGSTVVRNISISTDSEHVAFSLDGESWDNKILREESLFPRGSFKFKAKAFYDLEDREGQRKFDIKISAVSVG